MKFSQTNQILRVDLLGSLGHNDVFVTEEAGRLLGTVMASMSHICDLQ